MQIAVRVGGNDLVALADAEAGLGFAAGLQRLALVAAFRLQGDPCDTVSFVMIVFSVFPSVCRVNPISVLSTIIPTNASAYAGAPEKSMTVSTVVQSTNVIKRMPDEECGLVSPIFTMARKRKKA